MTTLVLDIPRPAMTANDQRRWHWTKVRKAKAQMQTLVWVAAKQARIAPYTVPVAVRVCWYTPNAIRRDTDALGPFLKAAQDGLVQAGVVVDDDSRHIRSATTVIDMDRERPRIEITITEENQQ